MSAAEGGSGRRRRDLFYRAITFVGRRVFDLASRPLILHREISARPGGFLLASNHTSPYDVACLMYASIRPIDFLSIRELMDRPLVGAFFRGLNALPLDRSRRDSKTVRQVVRRLQEERVVGMFPEGRIQEGERSMLRGGAFRSGLGRMARAASVPIVPVAILDTGNFRPWTSWLPLRRTRFAVAFGEPLSLRDDLDEAEARRDVEERWRQAVLELARELEAAIDWR